MATVVNTPAQADNSSGAGLLLGIIALIIFVFALFYWGIPAVQQGAQQGVQNAAPAGTEVQVPDEIDVNVSGEAGGGQ